MKKHIPLIEYHLTNHCNLNCKGCAHFSPIAEPWFANINEYKNDMEELSSKVVVDELILFGGEPLLHPNISEFLIESRKMLPNTKISVLTNGLLVLERISELKDVFVQNDVWLDITCYPIDVKYQFMLKLLKAFRVKYRIYNDLEPIKTLRKHTLSHERKENKWDCLMIRSKSVQLKNGKLYICPLQAYIDIFNKFFNEDFAVDDECILDLYKATDEEIVNMYFRKNSFCEYCREPIEKNKYSTSKKEKREWT